MIFQKKLLPVILPIDPTEGSAILNMSMIMRVMLT